MKQKLIILTLIAVIISSLFSVNTWADVKHLTRGEAAEAIVSACDDYTGAQLSDILRGYEDGELYEDRFVTRAEALVMLSRAFGELPEPQGYFAYLASPETEFEDVPDWCAEEIGNLAQGGILIGKDDGTLGAGDYIYMEDLALYIERIYAFMGTNLKDNFFTGVNKSTLEKLSIGDGKIVAGGYYDIDDIITARVTELIQKTAASDTEADTPEGKVKILYNNIMDKAAQNEAGIEPIKPYLQRIDEIDSVEDIVDFSIDTYNELGYSTLFNLDCGQDIDNSDIYVLYFSGASAPLSKEAFTGEADNMLDALTEYYETLFELIGDDEAAASENAAGVISFLGELSAASLNPEEYYDSDKINNKYSLEELDEIYKTVDMKKVFEKTGFDGAGTILVMDAGCLEKNAELLTDDNIDVIKNYLRLSLAVNYGKCMGQDFEDALYKINEAIYGITGKEADETAAAEDVSSYLDLYVDKLYGDAYYDQAAVDDVYEMTEEIIDVYRDRIKALDWMSDATKEKALLKLDTMGIKIGVSDNFDDYLSTAELKSAEDGGSYFQNLCEISKAVNKEIRKRIGSQADKSEWIMSCYTVNACYNPSANDITIPLASLNEPLYSPDYSFEENLGGIGDWIGHEISHAFDNNGSDYDENGNAVNWWTDEDREAFDNLCHLLYLHYDEKEAAPGITESGSLTLSENIADLGAMACITEVGSRHEGFDFKKMYEHFAKTEATVMTRETLENLSVSDVHSLLQLRVNVILQNIDKFYEVFDIVEGDGMWLAPEYRVSIW